MILYGGNNNWFAAYAYWYFKLYGHGDVKLLDGGRKKWELDARPYSKDAPSRAADQLPGAGAGPVDPRLPRRGRRRRSAPRTWSTCAAPTSSPAACSPRPTCRRSSRSAPGTSRPRSACRGARRPTRTAPSSPTTSCAKIYGEAGLDDSKDTIAYCRIGERSSHTWFVLKELLGQQNVKNYDGSWTEYGSLIGVPVALGDEPGKA